MAKRKVSFGISRPKWLKRLARVAGLYPDDLCLLERTARSGRPTFAVAYDRGERDFPQMLIANWTISSIRKGWVPDAIRGSRILRRVRGRTLWPEEIGEASILGGRCRPFDPAPPPYMGGWEWQVGHPAWVGRIPGIMAYSDEARRILRLARRKDREGV